ncbi:flagellar export chaperone FlgN [Alkaliphilus sp. B6464]|uniref:flagellar export chaperone FlgN n=1 Tax=Alkaliphilus sp. B6464 TaxID=2731219 RepID=UPI001BA87262|nr:flagellar export chaperone FlgN [Alkaliphilus sp. B6464]QUH18998.1 flagellar export chaperone FlgN [Alkaliphilus sp. B6464]
MGREELIEYLLKLSEGKLFLINQLLTLTQQQSEGLESEESHILNEIIEQKQNIMGRIDVLDKEFVSKHDLLKGEFLIDNVETMQADDKNNMRLLQDKIREIQMLTEKIQQIDNANIERLKKNMELVKNELKKVKFGKKIAQGYGNNKVTDGISIFVDKKQ